MRRSPQQLKRRTCNAAVTCRDHEVLLFLRSLKDEIGCFPLGLSLQQLKWSQQQQQRARAAGIVLVTSHTSRDILKSPSEPLLVIQALAQPPHAVALAPSTPTTPRDAFEYLVFHPCAHPCFPWAPPPCLLRYLRTISLAEQHPDALAAAVAAASQGTCIAVRGRYRGGFALRTAGLCVQGLCDALIDGDGCKNTVCISADDCIVTGLRIAHAQHHALLVTGSRCRVIHCTLTDARCAAIGVFGSASVEIQV